MKRLYRVKIGSVLPDTVYVEAASIPDACKKVAPKLADYSDNTRIHSVEELADEVIR